LERAKKKREHKPLQWSRAPKSAETSGIAVDAASAASLQWSRAPKSAETLHAPQRVVAATLPQWSRAPKSAETTASSRNTPTVARFNGAALRRARRRSKAAT